MRRRDRRTVGALGIRRPQNCRRRLPTARDAAEQRRSMPAWAPRPESSLGAWPAVSSGRAKAEEAVGGPAARRPCEVRWFNSGHSRRSDTSRPTLAALSTIQTLRAPCSSNTINVSGSTEYNKPAEFNWSAEYGGSPNMTGRPDMTGRFTRRAGRI